MNGHSCIDRFTPDEQWLADTLHAGNIANFLDRGSRGRIRAAVLRDLLLRYADADSATSCIHLSGIRIEYACIDGELDLADLARPGIGLPALALEDCDLPDRINLEGSRFARLSIKGSRFTRLRMRESEIDGPFDFAEATPYEHPDKPPEAWIDAQGCTINGQITGSGARLVAPKPRPRAEVKESDRRYALWLANADVRGSIILLNKFVAEGGVCLRSARIRGDIWATGAKVTRGEGFALNAQAARIGDVVALNGDFTANGKVWLLAAQIGARLLLDGATFNGTDDKGSEETHRDRIALNASNVQIEAAVFMGDNFTAHGEVNFSGATVRGSFRCQRACFDNRTSDGRARALVATSAELGDEVVFDGARVEGRMSLNGMKVGGRLSFDGATISNETGNGTGVALSAIGARIDGALRFAELGGHMSSNGRRNNVFRCRGRARLDGAEIGGDLLFRGCSLRNTLDEGSGAALSARRVRVGGNVEFKSTIAEGDLRLERIDIAGSLIWDGLKISRKCEDNSRAPLDLRHGRIGLVLNAKNLSFAPRSSIDLCGVRVGTIENTWPQGWGSPPPEQVDFGLTVNFDGLTYERIMVDSIGSSKSALPPARPDHLLRRIFGVWRNPLADTYGRWLRLQEKRPGFDRNDFFPQPYRQLARVLRNQGEESAAREIAIAEQWATPKPGLLPKLAQWAFGKGFGFGLRPRSAIVTLAAFLLLGMFGVRMAKTSDMLMESLVVASTGVQTPPPAEKEAGSPAHVERAVPRLDGSGGGPATEVYCTDAANTWTDDLVYAADMLVPFIPLHQEGKCEIVASADLKSGVWRSLKAVYEVTGWIIFSLALVTFSGVLKRFDRDAA